MLDAGGSAVVQAVVVGHLVFWDPISDYPNIEQIETKYLMIHISRLGRPSKFKL